MTSRSSWPVWAGFLLSILAFFSYLAFFVRFPSTRDFPWVNLILFGLTLVLVVFGLRRAFGEGGTRSGKIAGSIGATLSVLVVGLFVFGWFVGSRQLPASKSSPQVGQKAPAFRLTDSNGHTVELSQLLSTPMDGKAPKGVLLVFYRGYW